MDFKLLLPHTVNLFRRIVRLAVFVVVDCPEGVSVLETAIDNITVILAFRICIPLIVARDDPGIFLCLRPARAIGVRAPANLYIMTDLLARPVNEVGGAKVVVSFQFNGRAGKDTVLPFRLSYILCYLQVLSRVQRRSAGSESVSTKFKGRRP